MTWIKTVSPDEDDRVRRACEGQRHLYPSEYVVPVPSVSGDDDGAAGIVMSHSLIPDALYHSFATFGVLMSPELPLERRQHEMITTLVSTLNRCHY